MADLLTDLHAELLELVNQGAAATDVPAVLALAGRIDRFAATEALQPTVHDGMIAQLARLLAPGAPATVARTVIDLARAAATRDRIPALARTAMNGGAPQAAVARVAGVSRTTLRTWLETDEDQSTWIVPGIVP